MKKQSLLEFFAVLALFVVVILWAGSAVTNRDALWFYPVFTEQPEVVCLYRAGTTVAVLPGEPDYAPLVAALNADIPRHVGYYEGYAVSGTTEQAYLQRGYAIVAQYPGDVQVHTRFFFQPAPKLLLAIEGSYDYLHAGTLLFRGGTTGWLPGALALESDARIRAAADAVLAARPAGSTAGGLCATER